MDTLHRAASYGAIRRVPDPLKVEDVDALVFSMTDSVGFRVIPDGLYDGWRPRIDVEGRGHVVRDGTRARIQFQVRLDASSLALVIGAPTVLLALAFFNLIRDPSSTAEFWGLCGFAALTAGILVLRGRALVRRAWPGLLVVVQRLAEGNLYVPAA